MKYCLVVPSPFYIKIFKRYPEIYAMCDEVYIHKFNHNLENLDSFIDKVNSLSHIDCVIGIDDQDVLMSVIRTFDRSLEDEKTSGIFNENMFDNETENIFSYRQFLDNFKDFFKNFKILNFKTQTIEDFFKSNFNLQLNEKNFYYELTSLDVLFSNFEDLYKKLSSNETFLKHYYKDLLSLHEKNYKQIFEEITKETFQEREEILSIKPLQKNWAHRVKKPKKQITFKTFY